MKRRLTNASLLAAAAGVAFSLTATAAQARDFPPFAEVAKDYEKVVTSRDTDRTLYGLYFNKKKNQLLVELPRGYAGQKHYIAATQSGGGIFAGLQGPAVYCYWKRYDDRMALISPEMNTRSTGEAESRSSVKRLFTDRVLLDVPIITMGPSGQPVIDLDDLLIRQAGAFMGPMAGRFNARLATIKTAKAFPQNIEIAVEAPAGGGKLQSFHFSISNMKGNSGYKPRVADERIGYFTTVYRDLGEYKEDKKWKRYINRWHLEKRDPKLKISPPKHAIVFYIEHTVPVRYRRWVRDGVLEWNSAFRQIGIDNAIEVRFQDKTTGEYMDIDPEDVRYNFIRWLNNDISTAIGPSRAHPETGQILDADVVLTDGWIRAYWGWFHEQAPEFAIESFTPETLTWLESYPEWDPRILMASPEQKERVLAARAERNRRIANGEDVPPMESDPAFLYNDEYREIANWLGEDARFCMAAHGKAFDMAFGALALEAMAMVPDLSERFGDGEELDGIPEWFVGPMVEELVMHEVGHTLGLRHNFKSSSIYTMEEINSEDHLGKKPIGGSVMDYLPPNFNVESGEVQGDFCMIELGPYDMWAIEYGYTFGDTKEILARVAEPELVYLTDDDTGGSDPLARRYDLSKDPLDYAMNQMRLVDQQRGNLLDKIVVDGQSWSKARGAYQTTLSMQAKMLSMMSNWIGGAHNNRDRKGDPDGRRPVEVVSPEAQRKALEFVINHAFNDEAFGLSPELLAHMTVDKWTDQSPGDRSDATWPVHDRVAGIQGASLTMIMNPTTLKRIYDNEFRTPAGEDAVTLPEVIQTVVDAVYTEFGTKLNGATFTDREPMISSLRRGLQSGMTDRLISLADNGAGLPRPIRTLCQMHLRQLDDSLDGLLKKSARGQLDTYTTAHLQDMKVRIEAALNAVHVR